MKHLLDGGATKCPCRGGGCKICNASDSLVNYHNKIIKLGAEPSIVQEHLDEIAKWSKINVEPYLVRDKIVNNVEFPDEVLEAISNNKTLGSTVVKNKINIVADSDGVFTHGDNPNRECKWEEGTSPWRRCVFCGSLFRYQKGKQCPAFKGITENNV